MGSPDPFGDPKTRMRQAVQDIREALHALREGVVSTVMQRNRAQEQVTALERALADLDKRRQPAEEIGNPRLAAELREERARRAIELTEARKVAMRLTAAAESAKINLPQEEARLLQRARELQTQLIDAARGVISSEASGTSRPEWEGMFDRASEKTRSLRNEASARTEVANARPGTAATPAVSAEIETAEEMLAALEARIASGTGPSASGRTAPGESPRAALTETRNADAIVGPEALGGREPSAPDIVATSFVPSGTPNNAGIVGPRGETVHMELTQRVRVAAIGTGNIFRGAHLPAYPDIAQAQLVAFCDPDPVAQKAVLKRYHELMEAKLKVANERGDQATVDRIEQDRDSIRVCDNISEVIESIKPDLVDVCTQPVLHAPLSIQALEAGIHVMCEKPISRTWLESQRLLEMIQRTGKLYQHNENWLWDRDWYTAKKLVDSGAIGEPVLMFLATAHGGPEGAPRFWNSDFGGGGALLDNGIHAIGASWYVSGLEKRPTYVKAAQPFGMSIRMPNRILDGRFQKVRVDDDAHILIRFEDPKTMAWTTAHVEGSWSHRDSPDTVVIGTTGRILFVSEDDHRFAVVMDSYDREARRIEVSGPTWQHWPSSFYGEILNMVECVRNNVPSISDASFGAECSAIVGASYLSERDGRRGVAVEEFKTFARGFTEKYPGDPTAADNALVDALLSAVRK